MINHSPAQLIAELRRLMDMDYERLPGARHVLEEAIAVIRPLAEKSDVGEMIDPLRALVAQWRKLSALKYMSRGSDEDVLVWRSVGDSLIECADELEALLSAPVGSLPTNVSVVRCEHGGVQIEGHTLTGDWELELDRDGNVLESDGIQSAPVGSPPPQGCINCGEANDGGYMTGFEGGDDEGAVGPFCSMCWGMTQEFFVKLASAPRGGGETRPLVADQDDHTRGGTSDAVGRQDLPRQPNGDSSDSAERTE